MGLKFIYQDGQTPLDEEEMDGLKVQSITTHGELNELEQLNIEQAVEWIILNQFSAAQILTEAFIKKLHKKMFSDVWKWAGTFRKSQKNIGVDWIKIGSDLKYLMDDTNFWIINKTYSPDEITIRFKHRLVNIHCFPNGNGRHSRLMADIIIENVFDQPIYSWNSSNMVKPDAIRKKYINAIREADNGNIQPLMKFARE